MKKHLNIYIHVSLWMVYTFFLLVISNQSFSFPNSLFKTFITILVQMGIFYGNSEILFPRLLNSRKTWIYILNIIAIIFLAGVFFYYFERQFIPEDMTEMMQRRMERMKDRPMRPPPRQVFMTRVLFQILSVLFILIFSSAYAASRMGRKKEIQVAKSEKESLSSEMKFLKSQINPHFLFNSLNNIYSLTLSGSEKASEMILKLSSMLRYILYECNVPMVSLTKEWEYILNFVDFQKLKSQEELNIHLDLNDQEEGALIAPMIFIPFVENAFKHSHIENTEKGYVNISLNNKKEELIFQVDNSIADKEISKDEHGGIGLENVKRRLELIYGKEADLIINDNKNSYSIILRIQKSRS